MSIPSNAPPKAFLSYFITDDGKNLADEWEALQKEIRESKGKEDAEAKLNDSMDKMTENLVKITEQIADGSSDFLQGMKKKQSNYWQNAAKNLLMVYKESPNIFRQFIDKSGASWNGYSAMRQGKGTNALALTPARRLKEVHQNTLDVEGKLKSLQFFWEHPSFNVIVGAPNRDAKDLITSSTAKVQSMIERIFTSKIYQDAKDRDIEKAAEVHLYLDDYMKEAGITREKTAQEHITQALYTLVTNPIIWEEEVKVYNTKTGKPIFVTYKDEDGKRHSKVKTEKFGHLSPFLADVNYKPNSKNGSLLLFKDKQGRKYYKVVIYKNLAKYLARTAIAPFYNGLLKLNGNTNPSSLMFGRRILLHWNMNQGKPNENIISVMALLYSSALPFYDELIRDGVKKLSNGKSKTYKEKGSNFSKLIENPFQKDLDALITIGLLETWEYCDSNGEPLSEYKVDIPNYEVFSKLFVKFVLNKHIESD